MYTELNDAFPSHSFFYEVVGLQFGDALERCARMTGDDGRVFNYQGKIIFAAQHDLGNDNNWLMPIVA